MAKEGELLGCDAGLFRVIDGKREFVNISAANLKRLRLDAASDEKWRARRKPRQGRGSS